ncbi:hypothetical protein [Streptomyces virginiae]|uniref:hypothetical protein n=1 Tax=Streptomyces virginiae TaxID=1961 RepID=UPI002255E403|nr:hypothetical protein [Streptomyces virginiae]MCX4960958.1 hypothetical protein [Streptomyces virginiae]
MTGVRPELLRAVPGGGGLHRRHERDQQREHDRGGATPAGARGVLQRLGGGPPSGAGIERRAGRGPCRPRGSIPVCRPASFALGLPESVRLFLAVPWWRDAPGRTAEELRAVADEYREDVPDLDRRRDRAARALGLDPAGLPSEVAALARLGELSRGPVAAACLVVGYEGEPLDPPFGAAPDRP